MYNFVDVSGVGNSGKTAVSDILREFDRVWTPADSFEFDLFRLPNGILDLHHHLAEDWSPIRSHYAISRFNELIDQIGMSPSKLSWKKIYSTGNNYDRLFERQFRTVMKGFSNKLIAGSYQAEWPYELTTYSVRRRILHKLAVKLNIRSLLERQVYLSDSSEFEQELTATMNKLFEILVNKDSVSSSIDYVVLHNCFEPFNPVRSLNILSKSKSIIVYRDPRDVYVSGIRNGKVSYKKDITFGAEDEHGLSEAFLATYDINLFILRYQTYMKNIYKGQDNRVLKLRFEDLVHNYDQSLTQICNFLNLDSALHVRKKQKFQPSQSAKNIGKWRKYENSQEIKLITEKLSDFVWNS